MRRMYWGVLTFLILLDAITTVLIIRSGGIEYNPLWRPIAGDIGYMLLAKIAVIAALALTIPRLDRYFRKTFRLPGFQYCVLLVLLAAPLQNCIQMGIALH